jgi:two-component system response regulator AtoC
MNVSKNFSCLIVDDDAGFVSMLAKVVTKEGGKITTCFDLKSAREEIGRDGFDLVILDNRLPDGTGYEFFPQLNRLCPGSIILMMTAAPELSQAVELTRNGLFDYLTKPINVTDLTECLRRVKQRLSHPDSTGGTNELTGDSPAMREVIHTLNQLARHAASTVLLIGETGTGKDRTARMLHRLTSANRSAQPPFVPLNCAAVPAEMFESELFGSEKGAYTGAERRREGLIEAAEGGTLFLDEITEMPLPQQAKLLRFLDSREYRPLGANTLRYFTGRIIAATNRSVADEVKRGRFREDLMFRLSIATVRIPPLREHLSDIGPLTERLLSDLAEKYQRQKPLLRAGDFTALCNYHFPGNVRELRNLLERALLRTPDETPWLSFDAAWLSNNPTVNTEPSVESFSPPPPDRQLNVLDLQEYRLVQQALRAEGGGIRRAAARLGITHQALIRRLEKWPELRHTATRSN